MTDQNKILTGLTQKEVEMSRLTHGLNVNQTHDFTTLKIVLKTIFSVFNIVMAVLILVLTLVNEGQTAKFIGIVAIINTVIELVQEIRARYIIKKLNKLSEKQAFVIRGGKNLMIPAEQLVIGDIIRLKSGDRVSVDGVVVEAEYAEFDESILTGESKYITKKPGEEIRAGSFIASGNCYYRMTKFTLDSYIQTITSQIAKKGISESPLQSQINEIIKTLTYMTIFFIGLLVAEGIIQEGQQGEIILNASVLVTSLIPQGLVLITTISFAYGAAKMAKNEAIIQKLSSIEAMADTKVVCMDKTGTLTKNVLEVKEIRWLD